MNHTDDAGKMLVTLLARERALFRPFRKVDWGSGSTAARAELQAEFREKGIRWSMGGTAGERKAAERWLGEIVAAGLVEAAKSKGRKTHLRLTARGRQAAEVLTDHPGLAEARWAVTTLLQFAPAGQLVSELLPAGLKNYEVADYQEKLFDFQFTAMPAIIHGWIQTESDCHGRVAYRVTAEGERAAQRPEPQTPNGTSDDHLLKGPCRTIRALNP